MSTQRVATIATAPSRNATGAGSHSVAAASTVAASTNSASGARMRRCACPANGTSIRKPWCAASSVKRAGRPHSTSRSPSRRRASASRGATSASRRHRPAMTAPNRRAKSSSRIEWPMNSEPGATTACTSCDSPSPSARWPNRAIALRSSPGSSCSDASASAEASTSSTSPPSSTLLAFRSSRRTPSRSQPTRRNRSPSAFCSSASGRVLQREPSTTTSSVR